MIILYGKHSNKVTPCKTKVQNDLKLVHSKFTSLIP